MTVFISLDETLVNRINLTIEKYNNSPLPVEIVVGKFKGVFVRDIGIESYNKLFACLKNSGYSYCIKDNILISNYIDNFDIDLTQYNIRLQAVKAHYSLPGITHEFKYGITYAQSSPLGSIIEEDCTIRMFKHPDGSNQVNIIFKPGKYNINKLFQPLKRVFKSITKTNFLISYTERRQVTESYNILVKKNGKNPNMVFNKPYNLTREHISDVFNPINQYLLFPKLDGVRYLLYFIDSSSYLLNYTDFLKLSDDEDSDLDNTLLDGELIDNIYYPFDVLYCKGEDVRRKTRLDRLTYLEKINTTLKLVVIPPEKDIQLGLHKYFYNSNNPPISGLKDVFPPLDGVILASNINSYNNNKTLKYKPHTHQVIDFEIKYDGAGRGVLYVKDYNGGLTIFRGSDKYPYNTQYSHIKLDKYTTQQVEIVKKGGIVEFRWDQDLKTFIPVRNRNDKLNPNFIEVAKIIWDEINDPVKLFPNNYARLNSPFCKDFILSENINNGSGLFHSILYSGSEKYRNMVPDKKESFVKTLRQNFTANLEIKDWLKIGDGNIAFSMYKIFFIDSFKKIYNTTTVESPRLKNNIYYDMFKSHSLDFFVKTLLPEIFDISLINRPFPKTPRNGDIPPIPVSDLGGGAPSSPQRGREAITAPSGRLSEAITAPSGRLSEAIPVESCKDIRVSPDFTTKYFKDGVQKYGTALKILFSEISKISLTSSYKKFIGKLSISDCLDQDILDYISIVFKKDIFVLESSTGLLLCRTTTLRKLKSIIICYSSQDNIYKSVGRLNKEGIVDREFDPDDDLVKNISSAPLV